MCAWWRCIFCRMAVFCFFLGAAERQSMLNQQWVSPLKCGYYSIGNGEGVVAILTFKWKILTFVNQIWTKNKEFTMNSEQILNKKRPAWNAFRDRRRRVDPGLHRCAGREYLYLEIEKTAQFMIWYKKIRYSQGRCWLRVLPDGRWPVLSE